MMWSNTKGCAILSLHWTSVVEKTFLAILKRKLTHKPFWAICEPYYSNKYAKGDADILLIENSKILHDNREVANVFNNNNIYTFENKNHNHQVGGIFLCTWDLNQQESVPR